jgi:hypothetical protein
MTDAITASTFARKQAEIMYPEAVHIDLEEIEQDEKGKTWRVTLSFLVPPLTPSELLSNKLSEKRKVFFIDVKSGELRGVVNDNLELP